MCGIAGVVGPGASESGVLELLSPIRHRGEPSGRGECWAVDGIAIGTNRLKIVAPERGRQPLVSACAGVACVVNGEIYNYPDLARACGLPPECSDSEVVLAGYLRHGPQWIESLQGMFALAIVDRRGATPAWWLARDPLGIKPLYVARRGRDLVFASELKSFHGLEDVDEIDEVRAGSVRSSAGERNYWRVPDLGTSAAPEDEHGPIVADALERAVASHLPPAGTPLACLLSGGVDSSIVCALATRLHRGPVEAWTFASPAGGSSDLEAAGVVCKALGIPLHTVRPSAADLADLYLRSGVWMVETWEPALVRNAVSYHVLSRAVAEAGHKLCLSGEGADEVFGGYGYLDLVPSDQSERMIRASLVELPRTYLQMADRASMAATLEVRVPYMDAELVERCVALPASARRHRGDNKVALRNAFPTLLPREILARRKLGMNPGAGFGSNDPGQGMFHAVVVDRYRARPELERRDRAQVAMLAPEFGVDTADAEQLWNFARFVDAGFHRLVGSARRPQLNTTTLAR